MTEPPNEQIPSAIYARVSPTTHIKTKNDVHQSMEESINMCQRDADHEGNPIVKIYSDEYVSGKFSKEMLDFTNMMEDAHKGLFKRIYCRRVNRFGRNRADMIKAEIELTDLGVSLKFVENGIDTSKPFGKSIMAILADLAQQEREEILENTKRGRERAMREGTRSGKPWGHPKKDINLKAVRTLRQMPVKDRPTWKQIAKDYGASVSVILKKLTDAGMWDKEKRCFKT